MRCSEVTGLLSEYVDDALSASTRQCVEEHLALCKKCSAELESLHRYLRAIGSLSKAQAPPDFLERVHARLAQPSPFKKLVNWLFFPLKSKLPYEVAGVVLASLLIVFLHRSLETPRDELSPPSPVSTPLSGSPAPLEQTKPAGQTSAVPPERLKNGDEKTVSTESAMVLPGAPQKRVELVLLLRPPIELHAPPEPGRKEHSQDRKSPTDSNSPMQEQTLKMRAAPAPMRAAGKAEDLEPDLGKKTRSRIRDLVEQANGSVSSGESEKDTPLSQVIIAQIPAPSYSMFLEELGRLGQLQQPTGKATTVDQQNMIEIQIRLIPPQ